MDIIIRDAFSALLLQYIEEGCIEEECAELTILETYELNDNDKEIIKGYIFSAKNVTFNPNILVGTLRTPLWHIVQKCCSIKWSYPANINLQDALGNTYLHKTDDAACIFCHNPNPFILNKVGEPASYCSPIREKIRCYEILYKKYASQRIYNILKKRQITGDVMAIPFKFYDKIILDDIDSRIENITSIYDKNRSFDETIHIIQTLAKMFTTIIGKLNKIKIIIATLNEVTKECVETDRNKILINKIKEYHADNDAMSDINFVTALKRVEDIIATL